MPDIKYKQQILEYIQSSIDALINLKNKYLGEVADEEYLEDDGLSGEDKIGFKI